MPSNSSRYLNSFFSRERGQQRQRRGESGQFTSNLVLRISYQRSVAQNRSAPHTPSLVHNNSFNAVVMNSPKYNIQSQETKRRSMTASPASFSNVSVRRIESVIHLRGQSTLKISKNRKQARLKEVDDDEQSEGILYGAGIAD